MLRRRILEKKDDSGIMHWHVQRLRSNTGPIKVSDLMCQFKNYIYLVLVPVDLRLCPSMLKYYYFDFPYKTTEYSIRLYSIGYFE